jgi:hypothetical protein
VGNQRKHHRYVLVTCLFISLLLITACGSSNEPEIEILPTVAMMPTNVEASPIAEQPTLPPTWTPTLTETPTPSATASLTLTITPSQTITDTPTVTFTPSASPTQIPRPIVDLIQLAYEATILPSDYVVPQRDGIEVTLLPETPLSDTFGDDGATGAVIVVTPIGQGIDVAVSCPYYPVGGFATAYTSDASTAQLLGCPSGDPPNTLQVNGAYQVFERGIMMWLNGSPSRIYALYSDGTYQQFGDTFDENVDPESGGEVPPTGLREPTRGFGKVWRTFATVKGNLGWAVGTEIADFTTIQEFTRGQMVYIPARGDVLALMANADGGTGTWTSISGAF